MVLHQAVATVWKKHTFPKHNCALIPFNSTDSTQLFAANGCYFSCKIVRKYNGSYNGKRTNTFLSTSEMSHLSSGLCTESWHQMISFISFTVKLNLSQAPNCWEHEWRVSFTPGWEWKESWLAGLPLSAFNLCGAWFKWKLWQCHPPTPRHDTPAQLHWLGGLSASRVPVCPLCLHLLTFPRKNIKHSLVTQSHSDTQLGT